MDSSDDRTLGGWPAGAAPTGPDRVPTQRGLAWVFVAAGVPFLAGAASYVVLFAVPSDAAATAALIVGGLGVVLESAGLTGLLCEPGDAPRA